MKVVGIFLILFGYTCLYAGLSRIYGYGGNTVLGLLGFQSNSFNSTLGNIAVNTAKIGQQMIQGQGKTSGSAAPAPSGGSGVPGPLPNYNGPAAGSISGSGEIPA